MELGRAVSSCSLSKPGISSKLTTLRLMGEEVLEVQRLLLFRVKDVVKVFLEIVCIARIGWMARNHSLKIFISGKMRIQGNTSSSCLVVLDIGAFEFGLDCSNVRVRLEISPYHLIPHVKEFRMMFVFNNVLVVVKETDA